jgi:hypothetical protein
MQHRNSQTMKLMKPAIALTMALFAAAAVQAADAPTTNQVADPVAKLQDKRAAEMARIANGEPEPAAAPAPSGASGRANPAPASGISSANTGFDGIKTQLHATDEEWKIISPALQSVITLRQTANEGLSGAQGGTGLGGMMGGFGGGFGGPGGGDSFSDPGNRGGRGGGGGFGGGDAGGFGGGDPAGFGGGGPGGFGGGDPGGFGGGGRGGRGGRGGGGGGGGFGGGPGGFGGGGGGGFGGGDRGGFGGPGGGGGGGGSPIATGGGNNPVALALSELRTAISSTNAPADQIKEQVAAVRTARQKAQTDLAAAQKNLRSLLTADQEAVLVSQGYLE